MNRKMFRKSLIASMVISAVLLMPVSASAGVQDIIVLLNTIIGTLRTAVGQVLGGINSINGAIRNFEQQVIWPVTALNQARTEVAQIRAQLSAVTSQVRNVAVNSATLTTPKQLEQLLRNPQASSLTGIKNSYLQIFQSSPPATQATQVQRNLTDADDAIALDALQTATASDQASNQVLTIADSIEDQIAQSAPGSAPILSTQAQISAITAQAALLRLLAAQLRQEATRAAHYNSLRKQSAAANRQLRMNLQQILSR